MLSNALHSRFIIFTQTLQIAAKNNVYTLILDKFSHSIVLHNVKMDFMVISQLKNVKHAELNVSRVRHILSVLHVK